MNNIEALVNKAKADIDAAMSRHNNVALCFSGGKDSLACLHLMRDYWPRLTVVWGNPGDPYPETLSIMDSVRNLVGRFKEVKGDVLNNIKANGFPCDMVPISATSVGRVCEKSEDKFVLQSRYQCCSQNFWFPVHNELVAIGITLKVMGQRAAEELTAPITSGSIINDGIECLLPVENWTSDQVITYLKSINIDLPRWYSYGIPSPDCMQCTAYLTENKGRLGYLRKFYPEAAIEHERRLRLIQKAQRRDEQLLKIALGDIESDTGDGMHRDYITSNQDIA